MEQKHDFDEEIRTFEQMVEAYGTLDHDIITVPKVDVDEWCSSIAK